MTHPRTVESAPSQVRLPPAVRGQIEAWAAAAYPHEACGLLIGRAGAPVAIEQARAAQNLDPERRATATSSIPRIFLAAEDEARARGLDVVGVWHSHPDHPARPSETDRAARLGGLVLRDRCRSPRGRAGDAALVAPRRRARSVEEEVLGMSQATHPHPDAAARLHRRRRARSQVHGRHRARGAASPRARATAGLPRACSTSSGELRSFVNVFVGSNERQRSCGGLRRALADGAVVSIVPAVAGGAAMKPRDQRLAELRARDPEVTPRGGARAAGAAARR